MQLIWALYFDLFFFHCIRDVWVQVNLHNNSFTVHEKEGMLGIITTSEMCIHIVHMQPFVTPAYCVSSSYNLLSYHIP
jgi:hypothetical protein